MNERRAIEVEPRDTPLVGGEPFESFYARQLPKLLGLAYAASGSRLGAEDLAHDALIAAYRDWDRIRRLDNPEAWVRRILLNRAVSGYRRRMSEVRAVGRLAVGRTDSVFAAISPDADRIWTEVRRLPRRQTQVVALRYLEDLTLSEIGSILGCSKEAVNTHLRRARATLARRLDDEEGT